MPPGAPDWLFLAAVAVALLVSAAWWVMVALLFSLPSIRRGYGRVKRPLDAIAGGILVVLGVRLAASR